MQCRARLKKELEQFQQHPVPGILCWPTDNLLHVEASIIGPDNTPYENGAFKLDVQIPERYPFEPPKLRFDTRIYHPNIDSSGRICLDVLKMPPGGSWKPSISLVSVFRAVQMLMSEPNFDDPLMSEIADEYRSSHELFAKHAHEWTIKYAMPSTNTIPVQSVKQKSVTEDQEGNSKKMRLQ